MNIVDDHCMQQYVKQPTRFRNNQQPSCLDLVFANPNVTVYNLQILPPLGKSDHVVLSWRIPCTFDCDRSNELLYPQYGKADFTLINAIISQIDWEDEFEGITCNEAWIILRNFLSDVVNNFIPHTTRKSSGRPPWLNPAVKRFINIKARRWSTYKRHPNVENWKRYTEARQNASDAVYHSKNSYEEFIARKSRCNIKLLHSYFRSKRKKKQRVLRVRKADGLLTTNKQDTANCMNEFFHSIFNRSATLPSDVDDGVGPNLSHLTIDIHDVSEALHSCNPTKAPGPDLIHSSLLRHCAESLALPLHTIFNKSLGESSLPDDWKDASITPIHKSGDPLSPNNYRPISLTSQVSKIFEKIVAAKLTAFLEDNNIISVKQHGFRKGFSCLTNLLESLEYWTGCIDRKTPCDVILLDIRKAFDTVSHAIVMKKLNQAGVHGPLFYWFGAFLTGRRQRTCIDGQYSNWLPVSSGVPQGTVLGPLLFLLYVNDLPSIITSLCNLFADDTKLYRGLYTADDTAALQADLISIQAWANQNELSFNVDKCEVVHLGVNNPHHTYQFCNAPLKHVDHIKTLGVTLDSSLKPSIQCVAAVKKANCALNQIRHYFDYLNPYTLKLLYISYVRPHLDYCVQAWSPYLQKDISILEAVQRRATKLVPQLQHLDYEERLRCIGIQRLDVRRQRGDILQAFKIIKGFDKLKCEDFFQFRKNSITRGHDLKLFKPQARTLIRSSFFSHRVVDSWNSLPTEVVMAPTPNICKARFDKIR